MQNLDLLALILKSRTKNIKSKDSTPESILAFPAPAVNLLYPLIRLANAAATPIKGSNTYVARLSLPLTICGHIHNHPTMTSKFFHAYIFDRLIVVN